MGEEYLLLSGIQHFCFCRRRWALIHLEQQWQENLRTAEGRLDHTRCHDDTLREKRGNLLTVRGMRVVSHTLRLSGICDVVEFHTDQEGVPLQGYEGRWLPLPVEYKHGSAKQNDADWLQLCAQAIALEEMLVCAVPRGALYYVADRRREVVEFTPELRQTTGQGIQRPLGPGTGCPGPSPAGAGRKTEKGVCPAGGRFARPGKQCCTGRTQRL